jgi:chemotaxis signal transduction protein
VNPSSRTASAKPGAARIPSLVCAFAVGTRCYAVDVALVSEVVTVERLAPVPRVPAAVLGVFSLRGMPVALLDPGALLELPDEAEEEVEGPRLGLLVMPGKLPLGALRVTRVEGIVAVQPDQYRVRESSEEHPAVQGFLKLTHRDGLIATVLNMEVVTQRIAWLKPRERTERTTHDE